MKRSMLFTCPSGICAILTWCRPEGAARGVISKDYLPGTRGYGKIHLAPSRGGSLVLNFGNTYFPD